MNNHFFYSFQAFDQYLQAKFPTLKRYSGEGAEGMLAFFDLAFQQSVQCMF